MSTNPGYASTPRNSSVSISTANTNRDGTGTVGTVFTAGSSGSRIDQIQICPAGTVTAGMVRIFIHNGTSYFLYREVPITANTPSGTAAVVPVTLSTGAYPDMPIILPSGYSLRASTHNAETFHVTAIGGDF